MTLDECEQVIRRLGATWGVELAEDRIVVWIETLEPLEYDQATEVIKALKEHCVFVPSHAEFLERYWPAVMPPARYAPMLPYPDVPRLPPEEAKARFEEMRRALARSTKETTDAEG